MPRKLVHGQTAEFHRYAFITFSRYELAAGGPDPHMNVIGYLGDELSEFDRDWLAGCYVAVYNVPTAELLFQRFTPSDALDRRDEVEAWLREHWKGLVIRRERRPVKSPRRLAEFLQGYAHWMYETLPDLRKATDFETVWNGIDELRYVGRYAALKLLETLRRYNGVTKGCLPDIRPKGGWSPRIELAYLFPEHIDAMLGNDSAYNCDLADELGLQAQQLLKDNGVDVDLFTTEVLLCDTKQAWHRRQYPGRSNDSELEHHRKVVSYWGDEFRSRHLDARREVFPHWSLGELRGWDGVRKELVDVLADNGYTWTDSRYDYHATVKAGFDNPVERT